jgi:hypothetical protein
LSTISFWQTQFLCLRAFRTILCGEKQKLFHPLNFCFLYIFSIFFTRGKMQTRTSNVKVLSRFTFYPCMSSIFYLLARRAGENLIESHESCFCHFMPLHCVFPSVLIGCDGCGVNVLLRWELIGGFVRELGKLKEK